MEEEKKDGTNENSKPAENEFLVKEPSLTEDDDSEESAKETEFQPPQEERNQAVQFNSTVLVAAIIIGIVVILLLVHVIGSLKQKKKEAKNELDKAGTKYEQEFNVKEKETPEAEDALNNFDEPKEEDKKEEEMTLEEAERILRENNLDISPNQGTAPVTPVGSSGYSSSSGKQRPDTRNSNSIRNIEGIKGVEYKDPNINKNIVGSVMSAANGGGYGTANAGWAGTGGARPSREEFIQQQMQKVQQLQQMYQTSGSTAASVQGNRQQFYENGMGNAGNEGQYMSYSSLWDGTIISGALVTAINTDNPGVVIARVTENVYSSYDHSFLLIPEGSLLYATYNSSISYGQNKVQVAWNLLIRPDGYRINLGNMNGVNAQGESGYRGRVSNHTWQTMKALGLIAMYSMIETEVTNDIKSESNEYMKNMMTDVYAQAAKMGNKILDRALDIQPTIKIKSGTEIKLITNAPLELPPCEVPAVNRRYVRTR